MLRFFLMSFTGNRVIEFLDATELLETGHGTTHNMIWMDGQMSYYREDGSIENEEVVSHGDRREAPTEDRQPIAQQIALNYSLNVNDC